MVEKKLLICYYLYKAKKRFVAMINIELRIHRKESKNGTD